MSKWKKSSPELIELFQTTMDAFEGIERRKMFGYPCSFMRGNMFTGLHEENWVLRLDEKGLEEIKKTWKALPFEPMEGKKMKQYVLLPKEMLCDSESLRNWINLSLQYVSSLPPKVKR